jgi:hypothetical protein
MVSTHSDVFAMHHIAAGKPLHVMALLPTSLGTKIGYSVTELESGGTCD